MAYINCQACGKKVSDRAPECSFCGNPITSSLPQEKLEPKTASYSTQKLKKSKNLINPVLVISVIVALAISFGAYTAYKSIQTKKANREFSAMAGSVSTDLIILAANSEKIVSEIRETWQDSIFNKHKDFNIALAVLIRIREKDITGIKILSENIAIRLKGMTPPTGKEREFQRLKELYLLINKYAEMSNPSGSFQSYSQQAHNLNIEVKSAIRELELVN